jgi:hypothetical protein
MTRTIRRAITRRYRCSFGLATALTCGLATSTYAEVHVEGNLGKIRVTTNQDAISDVLSAFAATFNVKYRTAIPLDAAASATYAGSLRTVISRLLDGYNYVIKTDQNTTEIVIFGRSGKVANQPSAPKDSPSKGILSRWR